MITASHLSVLYYVLHCMTFLSYDGRLQYAYKGKDGCFLSQIDCIDDSTLSEDGKAEGRHALIVTLCKLDESIFNEAPFYALVE